MYYSFYESPIAPLVLIGNDDGLVQLYMQTDDAKYPLLLDETWTENDQAFTEVIKQLDEYFAGKRQQFDLNLAQKGTDFQEKVWQALTEIPFGQSISYKELASMCGNPNASRAVGSANGKNHIPLIVPCHRVIASNGSLAGFAFGTTLKEKLLRFESLMSHYHALNDRYGNLNWWPAENVISMMVGAVLTQNTSWVNVEKSFERLPRPLSAEFLEAIPHDALENMIRPSGFYTQKAKTIKSLIKWFKAFGYNTMHVDRSNPEKVRKELLSIKGIGEETADCILLYALEIPTFVIDKYTKRWLGRMGYPVLKDYEAYRQFFMEVLPKDSDLYNNYHALIVQHGKMNCKSSPDCDSCSLKSICKYANNSL